MIKSPVETLRGLNYPIKGTYIETCFACGKHHPEFDSKGFGVQLCEACHKRWSAREGKC